MNITENTTFLGTIFDGTSFQISTTTYILLGFIVVLLVTILIIWRKWRKLKQEEDNRPVPDTLPPLRTPQSEEPQQLPPISYFNGKVQEKVTYPEQEQPELPVQKPKSKKIEKAENEVVLEYENQLDLDIQQVKTKLEIIKNTVRSMKTTYTNLESKLAKLEQVKDT
jgi:hypothetical protein